MSFQSVHDLLTPPTIVRKQKFWDWMSGDSLKSWWTFFTTGSGAGSMSDSVDGGYLLDSGASSGSDSAIWFNGIDHYSHTGSKIITVHTISSTADINAWSGLTAAVSATASFALMRSLSSITNFFLSTKATAGGNTNTQTSIARDTSEHKWEVEMRTSSAVMYVDSVLEVVGTATLPDAAMEPTFLMNNLAASSKTINARRCEVFNT